MSRPRCQPLLLALLSLAAAKKKKKSMAYTSILYGVPTSSPHHSLWSAKRQALTCLVAASGMQLAQMDPLRDRVLVPRRRGGSPAAPCDPYWTH